MSVINKAEPEVSDYNGSTALLLYRGKIHVSKEDNFGNKR